MGLLSQTKSLGEAASGAPQRDKPKAVGRSSAQRAGQKKEPVGSLAAPERLCQQVVQADSFGRLGSSADRFHNFFDCWVFADLLHTIFVHLG